MQKITERSTFCVKKRFEATFGNLKTRFKASSIPIISV